MKEPKVILFDGDDEIHVTAQEIKSIEDKTRLVALFHATAVYRDLFKTFLLEEQVDQFQYKKVDRGFRLLSDEIMHRFGEDTGLYIIARTSLAINLEKMRP
jgi:hypothetical protein